MSIIQLLIYGLLFIIGVVLLFGFFCLLNWMWFIYKEKKIRDNIPESVIKEVENERRNKSLNSFGERERGEVADIKREIGVRGEAGEYRDTSTSQQPTSIQSLDDARDREDKERLKSDRRKYEPI